ncbi:hypothetical protein ACA910_019433 [Epithemia clementina (nom. ined.)]
MVRSAGCLAYIQSTTTPVAVNLCFSLVRALTFAMQYTSFATPPCCLFTFRPPTISSHAMPAAAQHENGHQQHENGQFSGLATWSFFCNALEKPNYLS